MADYISREAAAQILRKEAANHYPTPFHVGLLAAARVIEAIHAADVRPAVRGHIEEDENTYLFCSECNCNITLAAYETPDNRLVLRPNFCPNCGADMREEN